MRIKKHPRQEPAGAQGLRLPGNAFFAKVADFFLLTCFWLLTSLPLVTVGASTAAVFYVLMKIRKNEQGPLWQTYIASFKENLKQSVFIWLLYAFIALDAAILLSILIRREYLAAAELGPGGRYFAALLVLCLLYAAMLVYAAALQAAFRQTVRQCLTAAFAPPFGRPLTTLYIPAVLCAVGLAVWFFPPLAMLALPLALWLASLRIGPLFDRQMTPRQENKDASD